MDMFHVGWLPSIRVMIESLLVWMYGNSNNVALPPIEGTDPKQVTFLRSSLSLNFCDFRLLTLCEIGNTSMV
jgi:hypothetical protein